MFCFLSEEVRRAAYAAPVAIFVAVIGTGLIGWLLNISLVLCSGPIENLPGPTGLAFIEVCSFLVLGAQYTQNNFMCRFVLLDHVYPYRKGWNSVLVDFCVHDCILRRAVSAISTAQSKPHTTRFLMPSV